MAAWIGPQGLEPRGLFVDAGEDASQRRLVEFMLGPSMAKTAGILHHQLDSRHRLPTTLDLLPGAISDCSNPSNGMSSTHIELEAEIQLPAGWEKCLNLKDGSIYFLNRATGAMSAVEPRKQGSMEDLRGGGIDPCASPTTSELTAEACNDATSISKASTVRKSSCSDVVDSGLDLTLSLHVGGCLSPKPARSADGMAPSLRPRASASAKSKFPTHARAPAPAPAACSPTSSSSTPPLINASLAYSQAILSSTELAQQSFLSRTSFRDEEANQVTRLSSRGRSFYEDIQSSLCAYDTQRVAELGQKLGGSEALPMASPGAMVTVACANCLMFVMLSRGNQKCPRCGSNCSEQIDFSGPLVKRAKLGFSF